MFKWTKVAVLVLLVLVAAMAVQQFTVQAGTTAVNVSATVANTGGPVPPTPWATQNTGGPVPPTPWRNTGGPVPPTPWTR